MHTLALDFSAPSWRPRVNRLIAIEDSLLACADFVYNLDEFDNVELYQGRVEQVLPALEVLPQVILVDPPRSGLDRRAMDGILAMQPEVLVYVSCDPATLARDSRRLTGGGYRLEDITPFDLFPQTYHIESISFWHRQ
jgi:23S rRNA (uracil1939-C5)-methyltransferase